MKEFGPPGALPWCPPLDPMTAVEIKMLMIILTVENHCNNAVVSLRCREKFRQFYHYFQTVGTADNINILKMMQASSLYVKLPELMD